MGHRIKQYRDWSIFSKIFSMVFIVIGLLFILTIVNFILYRSQNEASTRSALRASATQAANEISNYLDDVKNLTLLPYSKKYNGLEIPYVLDSFSNRGTLAKADQSSINLLIRDALGYKKDIHSVFLTNVAGDFAYDFQMTSVLGEFDPESSLWFQKSLEAEGEAVVGEPYLLSYYEDLLKRDSYMYPVARAVRIVPGNRATGVILINTNIKLFDKMISNMKQYPDQRIVILDQQKKTVYDTDHSQIAREASSEIVSALNEGNRKWISGKEVLAETSEIQSSGWTMINIVPTKALNQNINQMAGVTYAIVLGIILISAMVTGLISTHIVNPIKELAGKMKLVEQEKFDITIQESSGRGDEIGTLYRSFGSMVNRLNRLINEVYADKIMQKDLELSMLQSQINPHFLYNTLESISMMAEINDDREGSDMAATLGRMMRYSLNSRDVLVPLSEELHHLNEYVALQMVRLSHLFTIHVTIEEGLSAQKVIHLMFQPIVENAINHGMKSLRSDGRIEVTGEQSGKLMIFHVRDNGKGMDPGMADRLNQYINGQNQDFSSIGLRNVNKRIQLNFGPQYGLTIASSPAEGTCVTITLPTAQTELTSL